MQVLSLAIVCIEHWLALNDEEQIKISQCRLVFRQGVTAKFNGMNEVVVTVHADTTHPFRVYTTWPVTHICRVIIIRPTKIPHLKLATFDKHHIVQRLHDSIQQLAADLSGKLRISLIDSSSDLGDFFGRQFLAFRQGK
ncbi:hypothetical protein D3C77_485980 [compost metagenome]